MSGTTDRRSSRLLWLRTVSERGQRHPPEDSPFACLDLRELKSWY